MQSKTKETVVGIMSLFILGALCGYASYAIGYERGEAEGRLNLPPPMLVAMAETPDPDLPWGPFAPDGGSCPACGATCGIEVSWRGAWSGHKEESWVDAWEQEHSHEGGGTTWVAVALAERLLATCTRCDYRWHMLPAYVKDSKEE